MTRLTWVCVFHGHSGAYGRAVFETKEQARQFAERHARAMTPTGVPLKWEDAEDSAMLTTVLGDYLVAPVSEDERRRLGIDEN